MTQSLNTVRLNVKDFCPIYCITKYQLNIIRCCLPTNLLCIGIIYSQAFHAKNTPIYYKPHNICAKIRKVCVLKSSICFHDHAKNVMLVSLYAYLRLQTSQGVMNNTALPCVGPMIMYECLQYYTMRIIFLARWNA